MGTRPMMLNAAGQAVMLEDLENPWIDDIDGYERFQRTAPAVPAAQKNHIYADNPRKPNAGKQYLPIIYRHQDFPMAVYQPRVIASKDVADTLAAIVAAKDKDRQKAWDAFLDRLLEIELEIDFRQLALPEIVPDQTAIRMLRRTLVLQIQAAESEAWKTKNHPKTYADYQIFIKSPIMRIVRNAEELATFGRGWFKAPTFAPETEINAK
jgi:hypothetical protein